MYIVVDTESNRILAIGKLVGYSADGYPIVENNAGESVAYPVAFFSLHFVDEIPDYVVVDSYGYTYEEGFFKIEETNNPYGIDDELVKRIKDDAVTEIEEAVINGTDE